MMKKSEQLMMGAVHAQEYRQEFDQTYYRQVDNGDQVYAYRYICIVYLQIFKKTATMSRRQRLYSRRRRACKEDGSIQEDAWYRHNQVGEHAGEDMHESGLSTRIL